MCSPSAPSVPPPPESAVPALTASAFDPASLPLVVIAGRPNVGKSTLFNRLMHRRLAITDPSPGVTRDPVEGVTLLDGKPVRLIDTGGYKLTESGEGAELDAVVAERALRAAAGADCILLVLEAGEFTAEDEELIASLRPFQAKTLAAVNKTEGGRLEGDAWNCARFGFSCVIPISAEHGDHIPDLCRAAASRLDFSRVRAGGGGGGGGGADARPVRIALLGKPNTGKSTFANRLIGEERSIVSAKAGTTRDVVEGAFTWRRRAFEILDTAGIRRRARVKENVEYYSVNRAIKTLERADIVILLIDAEEGLTEQDKKIAALASEKGRGIIFALNKWDTQEPGPKRLKRAVSDIRVMFAHMEWAPVLPLSALTGAGADAVLETALRLYGQLNRTIETAPLNAALRDWVAAYPPPASRVSRFALRYLVQSGVNPVSFILFATRPETVPQSYTAYLLNKMRSTLGFENIPLLLELRASRQKWEERAKA